jgi:hypothetical protein
MVIPLPLSVPVAGEGGLYVAQAQGFFARQGLNVKIDSITGAERAIADLQTGRAQSVAGNYVSFIRDAQLEVPDGWRGGQGACQDRAEHRQRHR